MSFSDFHRSGSNRSNDKALKRPLGNPFRAIVPFLRTGNPSNKPPSGGNAASTAGRNVYTKHDLTPPLPKAPHTL